MVVLTLLTIVYLVFWMCLGILYSVLTKRPSTSIMTSIATWLTFSIIVTILASVVAGFLVPLPGTDFRKGGDLIKLKDEYMEALQQRNAVISTINKISPTNLYEDAASDILGVAGGQLIAIEQDDLVSGGVMQPRHKVCAVGYFDSFHTKLRTNSRGIQQTRQRAGVDLTGLAAAGTTIQPRPLWVIAVLAAMTDQQDQAGKILCQAHSRENLRGYIRLARNAPCRRLIERGAKCPGIPGI